MRRVGSGQRSSRRNRSGWSVRGSPGARRWGTNPPTIGAPVTDVLPTPVLWLNSGPKLECRCWPPFGEEAAGEDPQHLVGGSTACCWDCWTPRSSNTARLPAAAIRRAAARSRFPQPADRGGRRPGKMASTRTSSTPWTCSARKLFVTEVFLPERRPVPPGTTSAPGFTPGGSRRAWRCR